MPPCKIVALLHASQAPHCAIGANQISIEPAEPGVLRSPRLPSLAAFERRPVVRVDSVVMGRHPKPVTRAAIAAFGN